MDEVLLSLSGPRGEMSASQLINATRAVVKLLDGAAHGTVPWRVSTLSEGSLHVGLTAPTGAPPEVESAGDIVVSGLNTLRTAAAIPHGFTVAMVKEAQRLAAIAGKDGVADVSVSAADTVVRIDQTLAEHAASAIAGRLLSIGSVQGILDKVNFRNVREFGLIDQRTNVSMTCSFGPELDVAVKHAIDTPVVVTGTLARNAAGQKVSMRARSIEPLAKEPPQPVEQLVGVLGEDWTGGLDSVEFVRTQRG